MNSSSPLSFQQRRPKIMSLERSPDRSETVLVLASRTMFSLPKPITSIQEHTKRQQGTATRTSNSASAFVRYTLLIIFLSWVLLYWIVAFPSSTKRAVNMLDNKEIIFEKDLIHADNHPVRMLQDEREEEFVNFEDDINGDAHFHPGHMQGGAVADFKGSELLGDTFSRAPEWSTQERYDESGYSNYFYIRDENNTILTDNDINNVKNNIELYATDGTRGDSASEEQQAYERTMKLKLMPDGVYVMCYCGSPSEILERCGDAKTRWGAEGIYIQMHDPNNEGLEFGSEWYDNIKTIKAKYHLKISGIFFEGPNWEKLNELLLRYNGNESQLFDSVIIMWDDRITIDDSMKCITSVTNIDEYLTDKNIPIRYLAINENEDTCKTSFGISSVYDLYINDSSARNISIPSRVLPLFPCYGDYVGGCYRAITEHTASSCDSTNQRYVFSPYNQASNRVLHLYNEVCLGVGINLPPHDVVMSLL